MLIVKALIPVLNVLPCAGESGVAGPLGDAGANGLPGLEGEAGKEGAVVSRYIMHYSQLTRFVYFWHFQKI